jgi:WD40 repeat protein
LSFNPFNEWILATASGDATIKLFDLRKLSRSLHTFDSHEYVLPIAFVSFSLIFLQFSVPIGQFSLPAI